MANVTDESHREAVPSSTKGASLLSAVDKFIPRCEGVLGKKFRPRTGPAHNDINMPWALFVPAPFDLEHINLNLQASHALTSFAIEAYWGPDENLPEKAAGHMKLARRIQRQLQDANIPLKWFDGAREKARLSVIRVPPSTPPEVTAVDSLSMPTLPGSHPHTVPALYEMYRHQRSPNPTGFDQQTQMLIYALTQAKIERGGNTHLLPAEFTAELASRLDAQRFGHWEPRDPINTGEEADQIETNLNVNQQSAINSNPKSNATSYPSMPHSVPSTPSDSKSKQEPTTQCPRLAARNNQIPVSQGSIKWQAADHIEGEANGQPLRKVRRVVIEITETVTYRERQDDDSNDDEEYEGPLTVFPDDMLANHE